MSVGRLKKAKIIVSQSVDFPHKKERLHSNQLEKHCILELSDPWVAIHINVHKVLSSTTERRPVSLGLTECLPSARPINIPENNF